MPLVGLKKVLILLQMCPSDKGTIWWLQIAYKSFSLFALLLMMLSFGLSVSYFAGIVSIDLEESLFMVYQVASTFDALLIIIIGIITRNKIQTIFEDLSTIYQKYSSDASFEYLAQTNAKCEWFLITFRNFTIYAFTIGSFILSPLTVAFCYWNHGKFDINAVFVTFQMNLPWNQETLPGYFGEMILYVIMGDVYLMLICSLVLLFISICLHHQAFFDIFHSWVEQMLQASNKKAHLKKIIDFHNITKMWFANSADFFSPLIATKIFCTIIFLASVILQLDTQVQHLDSSIAFLLMAFSTNMTNLFLFCYFGKSANESYENLPRCLFESNWHELPVDLQKYLVMMIANAQRPQFYHGCGMIVLNLETFTRITKSVVTYYMMFKTLTS